MFLVVNELEEQELSLKKSKFQLDSGLAGGCMAFFPVSRFFWLKVFIFSRKILTLGTFSQPVTCLELSF
jgi:hypothetical protein